MAQAGEAGERETRRKTRVVKRKKRAEGIRRKTEEAESREERGR